MNHDQILTRAPDLLSPRELEAIKRLGSADKLSPQTGAQLFVLFLQGYNIEQIATQNPSYGGKGLGLVARASIEFDWHGERSRYLQGLMSKVRETVEKSTMESIQFASDAMAVFHKLAGTKFRKYLQTGNTEDLGEFASLTFKQYRDFVSLLQTLTGQDQEKQQVNGEIIHRHIEEQDYPDPKPVPKFEDVLKMLEEGKMPS